MMAFNEQVFILITGPAAAGPGGAFAWRAAAIHSAQSESHFFEQSNARLAASLLACLPAAHHFSPDAVCREGGRREASVFGSRSFLTS
jgi:hypothetical protein